MTELTQPIAPIVFEELRNLRREYDEATRTLTTFAEHDRNKPNVQYLGLVNYYERWDEGNTQEERLAELHRQAELNIEKVHAVVELGEQIYKLFTANEAELIAYDNAYNEWVRELSRLRSEKAMAEIEARMTEQRAKREVGVYVVYPTGSTTYRIIHRTEQGGTLLDTYSGRTRKVKEILDLDLYHNQSYAKHYDRTIKKEN
jgi:hypothetical protein